MTDKIKEATAVLYNSGMLARSEDEAELLKWFRDLPEDAKRIEFARAQGMANAMVYARLEARAERRPR